MKKLHLVSIALFALGSGLAISWLVYDSRPITLQSATWFGDQARALPEFQLVDQNEHTFGNSDMAGKWNLLFFGYTHCPDICPASLQMLSTMLEAIDDKDVRDAIQVIFVSVDPERDTSSILKAYVEYFNKNFIGASAPISQLQPLTQAIGISHSLNKSSEEQSVYEVSHSSAIILVNPEVKFTGLFGAPHDALAMSRDLVKIVERN
jgi:protein SCO1/2